MKHSDFIISRYCLIRQRRIILNGKKIIEEEKGGDFASFLSSVYKTFGSEYSKFYKMDLLSKLGLLTTDFLVDSGKSLQSYDSDKIAIVTANSNSSLETDNKYYQTIADRSNYYPNPGLFVYTLPNLLAGEISIKFAIKGESVFFISRVPDFQTLHTTTISLLKNSGMQLVITGWIDLDLKHNHDAALYLVESGDFASKRKDSWPFTQDAMEYLYFEKNLEE